jgi:hypothetical protein
MVVRNAQPNGVTKARMTVNYTCPVKVFKLLHRMVPYDTERSASFNGIGITDRSNLPCGVAVQVAVFS